MDNCFHCTREVLEGTGVYNVRGDLFCHAGCLAFDAEYEGADESVQATLRNAGIPPALCDVRDMVHHAEADTRYGWFIVEGSGKRAYERASALLRTTVDALGFHGRYNATLRAWYVPADQVEPLTLMLEHGWEADDRERPRLVRLTRLSYMRREERMERRAEKGRAYWAGIRAGKVTYRIPEAENTKADRKRRSQAFDLIVGALKDAGGVFNRNLGEWYVPKDGVKGLEKQYGGHAFLERVGANVLRKAAA